MGIEHERVVRRFFAAWEGHGDPAELASFMAEDSLFYGNRNWPPHEGRAPVRQWWERMLDGPPHDTRVEMLHVACDGNTVFTERIDTALRNGRRWYLPILGVGEVNDGGLISCWRDYFGAPSSVPSPSPEKSVRPMTLGSDSIAAAPGKLESTKVPASEAVDVVCDFFRAWHGLPDGDRLAGFLAERSFLYPHRD
jgi:limonene-1,2-epoxide hydrolase